METIGIIGVMFMDEQLPKGSPFFCLLWFFGNGI